MSLDIALLLDNKSLQKWEYQSILYLVDESSVDVNIDLVVVNNKRTSLPLHKKMIKFFSEFSIWFCFVIVRMLRNIMFDQYWHKRSISLKDVEFVSEDDIISCVPEPADDLGNELPGNIISELSDVDIAVRFGFGIIKGAALEAPKYGVLSYHHGDISEYRGRPAGFYELIQGKSTAGVTVQQLTEELDAGTVVAATQCNIEDCTSLRDVHYKQFSASPPLLAEGVQALIDNQLPKQPETLGPVYSTPSARDVLSYLWLRWVRGYGFYMS